MVVALTQAETLAVFVRGPAQLLDPGDAVHRQRGLVRPDQRARGMDEDDARGQPRHQLFEVA